jgi:peptide/nickel transport system permease protein
MKKWKFILSNFSWKGKLAVFYVFLMIFVGIFDEQLSIYSYYLPSGDALERPTFVHWLGTDDLGIDLFAQICHGAGTSLLIGLSSALIAGIGGSLIGTYSAYKGGWFDRVLMRIIDILIILPDLVLVIVIVAFFGPSLWHLILTMSLLMWIQPARIARSKVLALKQEAFVTVAKSYGASFSHMFKVHFLPHLLPMIMYSIIQLTGRTIVTESSLSFLGLGDPLSKSWGIILNHSMGFKGIYHTEFWKWWVMSPLLAILFLTLAIAILSRELERNLNKKD